VNVLAPVLRYVLPAVVTSYLLWGLLGPDSPHSDALSLITLEAMLRLTPVMIAYAVISIGIDALSLSMLSHHSGRPADLSTCARIKAASYALAIINYALGAAALIVLFRRRVGLTLQGSTGIVGTSAVTDLAMLVLVTATAAAFSGADGPTLERWVVALIMIGTLGGFATLRAPFSLGPLEKLRELEMFQLLRTIPLGSLLKLATLRIGFVLVFVAMGGGALWAFRIPIPLAETVVGMSVISLVGAVPVAVAGLGTVQLAAVELFEGWATASALVACSLGMQAAMIFVRGATALVFAREFTAEAVAASRGGEA